MATSVALVTGASSGIGKSFAERLAKEGRSLVVVARRESLLQDLATSLAAAHGVQVHVVAMDLADPTAPERLAADLAARGLEVDLLVNNAGFGLVGAFAEQAPERLAQMVTLNVTALTMLIRTFLPGMIARGAGGILNVASTAAFQPVPYFGAYAATKAYVLSLSEAIASEVQGTGVKVVALCPGPTQSEFTAVAAMQDSTFARSMRMMSAEEVVVTGLLAVKAGAPVAIPGFVNALGARLSPFMPRSILNAVLSRVFAPARPH